MSALIGVAALVDVLTRKEIIAPAHTVEHPIDYMRGARTQRRLIVLELADVLRASNGERFDRAAFLHTCQVKG